MSPSALQKTNDTNTDTNKDKQNNVLIIMYLLAVAIKRDSINLGTPETSAIFFLRHVLELVTSSVQCDVRYCITSHFKSKQVNYARWRPQNS